MCACVCVCGFAEAHRIAARSPWQGPSSPLLVPRFVGKDDADEALLLGGGQDGALVLVLVLVLCWVLDAGAVPLVLA